MGRGSAGGGRAGRASSARRATSERHAPQPVNHAASSAPAHSDRESLRSTLAEGMAFGAGTAVAHRAVDAVMGPPTVRHETIVTQPAAVAAAPAPTASSLDGDACNVHSKAFQDCVNSFGSDISKCQFYMDVLAECRKNFASTLIA